ncbi:TetR family transcriptional regulator [Nocardioides maradonensis]
MTKESPARTLRPAGVATRDAIAEAAGRLFAEKAYDAVSVRAIAAEAGVDPALVIRHFGSKELLFLGVMASGPGVDELLDGPLEDLGRSLVRYFLGRSGSEFRQQYLALAQASHHEQVRAALQRRTAEMFVEPLAARLTGRRRELRAALLLAQIGGLLTMLVLQEDPVLARAAHQDVIEEYGAALQQLLTPDPH